MSMHMPLLHVPLVVILFALITLIVLTKRVNRRREAIRRELLPALQSTGLVLSGDPLGAYQLQGTYGGVDVRLENHISAKPPWSTDSEHTVPAVRITFWAPVPYSLVCPKSATPQAIVQFPPTGRMQTGNFEFDSLFDVFMDQNRRSAQAPQSPVHLQWPPPNVLGALIDLQLAWLRVKDDAAELVFAPIEHTYDVPRVLMAAQCLALGARGHSSQLQIRRGPKAALGANADFGAVSLLGAAFGFALLLAGPVGAMTLCFLPFLREAMEEDVCGAGQRLLVSVQQMPDGTGYGMYCSGNVTASLALMHIICGALAAALVLGPMSFVGILQELRASVRPSH